MDGQTKIWAPVGAKNGRWYFWSRLCILLSSEPEPVSGREPLIPGARVRGWDPSYPYPIRGEYWGHVICVSQSQSEAGSRDTEDGEGHSQWEGRGHHIISERFFFGNRKIFVLCLFCGINHLQTIAWFQSVDIADQITLRRNLGKVLQLQSSVRSKIFIFFGVIASKIRSKNMLTMLF